MLDRSIAEINPSTTPKAPATTLSHKGVSMSSKDSLKYLPNDPMLFERLIYKIAWRVFTLYFQGEPRSKYPQDFEDLVQEGFVAATVALKKGANMSYLCVYVRGAMWKYFRDKNKPGGITVSRQMRDSKQRLTVNRFSEMLSENDEDSRVEKLIDILMGGDHDDPWDDIEIDLLEARINRLPHDQRAYMLMVYFGGLEKGNAAKRLGKSAMDATRKLRMAICSLTDSTLSIG